MSGDAKDEDCDVVDDKKCQLLIVLKVLDGDNDDDRGVADDKKTP